jgi:hypothetical protein
MPPQLKITAYNSELGAAQTLTTSDYISPTYRLCPRFYVSFSSSSPPRAEPVDMSEV